MTTFFLYRLVEIFKFLAILVDFWPFGPPADPARLFHRISILGKTAPRSDLFLRFSQFFQTAYARPEIGDRRGALLVGFRLRSFA